MTNKRKIINDPVYGFLTIDDDLLYDLISHPYLLRESQIKQLGFTYMVYPGAMHSRFSHMLGALNLMNRAIEVLRNKGVEISPEESLGVKVAILLHPAYPRYGRVPQRYGQPWQCDICCRP